MVGISPELARVVKAKEARSRRELAKLPWPEKVALVVRLQRMAEPVVKARNPLASAWRLTDAAQAPDR